MACCAPLLAPLFVGSAFVGIGAAGLGIFGSIEAGMVVLAVGLLVFWLYWRYRKSVRLADANAKCSCVPNAGCNTGNACDVPTKAGKTQKPVNLPESETPGDFRNRRGGIGKTVSMTEASHKVQARPK